MPILLLICTTTYFINVTAMQFSMIIKYLIACLKINIFQRKLIGFAHRNIVHLESINVLEASMQFFFQFLLNLLNCVRRKVNTSKLPLNTFISYNFYLYVNEILKNKMRIFIFRIFTVTNSFSLQQQWNIFPYFHWSPVG